MVFYGFLVNSTNPRNLCQRGQLCEMLPVTVASLAPWEPWHLSPLGEVARDIPGTKRPQRIDLKKDNDNDESETFRNNRNTRSKWIRSCHFDGWFMFYTNLYRSLQLFTDLNSMWFTRKSGFPQPHQVPAAFACPRALPGNIPVIKDSLDCEEIVSLSVYGKVTYMIQILLALRMLRSEREFHARIQVSPTS